MKNKVKAEGRMGIILSVLRYIASYKWFLLVSLIFGAVSVIFSLYVPVLIGYIIDAIIEKGNVGFAVIRDNIIMIVISAAIVAVTQWVMNVINNKITYGVVRDIRNDAIKKIQHLPLSYLDTHPAGDIVSRVVADADQFADGLLMGFSQFFTGVLTILVTLFYMLSINYQLAVCVVIATPLSLFVASFIAKKTYSMSLLQSEARGEETAYVEEMLGAQKVVSAFSYEDKAQEKFDEINRRLGKYSMDATFFSSLTNPATRFVNAVIYAGICVGGAFLSVGGGMTVGMLSCFLTYVNQYTKPFNEISGVIAELQTAIACAGRVLELIGEKEEPKEAENAVVLTKAEGNVEIKDVSFSYNKDRKLIEELSLSVEKGSRIAIVGPTGCGKTTLINLLMRFYDVNKGSISLDGIDIRELTRESLRSNIGMVLQETWLRKGTVRDNIAMGKPDATDGEIIEAAKKSHAHSFIRRLPKGYDTEIEEDGGNLSQGQKQLLCITRVMLTLPPMLILDEATSSIDTRTEIVIQKAFNEMMKGRTSFIVAHRLSTIKGADMILVMKDGNIIEKGTHKALLEKGGFYSELYNSQFAH